MWKQPCRIVVLLLVLLSGCREPVGSADFFVLAERTGMDVIVSAQLLDLSAGTVLVLDNSSWEKLDKKEQGRCRYFAAHGGMLFFLEPSTNTAAMHYARTRQASSFQYRTAVYPPENKFRRFRFRSDRLLLSESEDRVLAGNKEGALLLERRGSNHLLIAASKRVVSFEGLKTRSLPLVLLRMLHKNGISRIMLLRTFRKGSDRKDSGGGIFSLLTKLPLIILLHLLLLFFAYALYRGKRFGPGTCSGEDSLSPGLPAIAAVLRKGGDLALAVEIEREYTQQMAIRFFAVTAGDKTSVREQLRKAGATIGECAMLFGSTLPADDNDLRKMLDVFKKIQAIISNSKPSKGVG